MQNGSLKNVIGRCNPGAAFRSGCFRLLQLRVIKGPDFSLRYSAYGRLVIVVRRPSGAPPGWIN